MAKGTVNKVILIGRLGADPDVRTTSNGTSVASFNIATVERISNDGNWEDQTEWHRIVAFGKTAEFISNYCGKGNSLYVEGCIRTESWEDKDGNKRYTVKIIAREVQLLGGMSGSSESNSESRHSGKSNSSSSNKNSSGNKQQQNTRSFCDEDIPF